MTRVLYSTLRAVFGPPFAIGFRLRTSGRPNVPAGPAILAANHASFLDPVFIALGVGRPVRFLVAQEYYDDRKLNLLLRTLGTIPVGGSNRFLRSFRLIAEVLDHGGLVGIFPEGGITRDGTMKPFRNGAATIALRLGAPVIPIHVGGTFQALPRHAKWPRFVPVTIRFGKAIVVPVRHDPSRDEAAALTGTIRGAVAALAS
ncbi:MAG TPA: lysophospholipid acyltransferase family protein [Candidatus Polarisedimenticolaceae bacterium]|nr:lysophospholipid acyltransferase family protein [Candidatus Polarisedimenticolaceae bacterium]